MSKVLWNRDMLRRFKLALDDAIASDDEAFEFEGNTYLVKYAEYLYVYLDGILP